MRIKRSSTWSWGAVSADLTVGRRRLARRPFASVIAIVSIGVSIAVVGAMFSVLATVDLRAFPYAFADRLVTIYTSHDASSRDPGSEGPGLSYAAFVEYRRRSRSFERLEASATVTKMAGEADAAVEIIHGHAATLGFLPMLGVQPVLGRWFLDRDTVSGAARVAVLSYDYWKTRFGGDPAIVGKPLMLLDRFPPDAPPKRYEIIGVLPRTFAWDASSSYWLPMGAGEPTSLTTVDVSGRLRPGVQVPNASAEVETIAGDVRDLIEQVRPPGDRSLGGTLTVRAARLDDYRRDRSGGKAARLALFGMTVCILALAVANLLFLNLLSAEARRGELAVRRALGAERRWLIRQMVVEAALVVAPGLLLAIPLSTPLVLLASEKLGTAVFGVVPTVDAVAIGVMGLIALAITVILGVVPIAVIARRGVADGLLGRANAGSLTGVVLPQRAIVFVETAIAIVVMTAAGLMVKELFRLEYRELGYTPSRVVLVSAPPSRPRPALEVRALGATARSRVASVPGVSRTAILATDFTVHLRGDGMPERLPPTIPRAVFGITSDLFGILGVPVIKGRSFTDADDASHPDVTILSGEAARRLFGDTDPVGRKLALAGMGPTEVDTWTTVVGVVGDARVRDDPTSPRQAIVYRPFAQAHPFIVQVAARVNARTNAIDQALRAAASPMATGVRDKWTVTFLEDDAAKYLATPRFTAISLTMLAAVGLFLTVMSVFGVTATSVSLRTREIAIRVALGASSDRIVWPIVRETVIPVVLGLSVGLATSAEMNRLMKSLLHGSGAVDGWVYVLASILVVGAALVASTLPARRALRIDPSAALRFD
ncbi:MAG TPA: ABC transporter permease [Gemmatimonadaceae bacterium]|nr:ABC transporter permease [Gemmatimonadaceae bacterium]